VLGSVILYLDYATPLPELREYAQSVIEANPLWDRQAWVLQVADTTETTMVVRVLASAPDGPAAWDLRCDIREALLTWLQKNHPQSLPVQRNLGASPYRDGVVTAEEAELDELDELGQLDGAEPRTRRPRRPREEPVMPDPQTAHLDLQVPDHSGEDDDSLDQESEPADGSPLVGVPSARAEQNGAKLR
jgi:hypothetical protein